MDFNCIIQFVQEYTEFKECLTKKLKNNSVELKGEICYLIDNNWMEELLINYNKNNDLSVLYNSKQNIKNPIFILNILEANKYIENHKQFVIITDKIMQILFKNSLDDKKLYKFYIGYKKLIIEELKQNQYALFYLNPLEENKSKREGFLLQIGKDKKDLFKYMLEQYDKSKLDSDKYFPDSSFCNSKKKLSPKNELKLKISILLFYYEKYFISQENKFSIYQKYYLINFKWMDAFKEYIKYKEVSDSLNQYINKFKNNICYANINIDKFLQNCPYDFAKVFKEDTLENYKSIDLPASKLYTQDIRYYTDCYIIHYRIFDLIKDLDKNLEITEKYKVISKFNNKNVFLLDNEIINIGNFHNKIFHTKYVISYYPNVKFEDELNILLDIGLNKYFIKNNCSIKKSGLQNLEENKIIKGNLLILNLKDINEDSLSQKNVCFEKYKKKEYFFKTINQRSKYMSSKKLNKINPEKKNKLNNTDIKNTQNIKDKTKQIEINIIKINDIIRDNNLMKNKQLQYEKKLKENEEKEKEYLRIIEEKKLKENEYKIELEKYKAKERQNKEKDELKRQKEESNEKLNIKENNLQNYDLQKHQGNFEKIEEEKKIDIKKDKILNVKKEGINQRNKEIYPKMNYNENNKNNKKQLKIIPSSENVSPILIGLNKVGGIPYMNAILQCLIQNKSLTDSFLEESDKIRKYDENEDESKDEYEHELSKSYLGLIEKLWKINKNTQDNPYYFKNVVISYDKSFDKSNSEKIENFIDFILERLHQELKKKEINDIRKRQNDPDKEITYKNFLEKFERENSLISNECFGIVEISYKCLECNNNFTYYNYEILKYISFNLEEIKNTINSKSNDSNNNKITIDDCFQIIYNNNIFIQEKNYFCYNCNKLTRCKYYMKLLKLPNTLIIILNRNINKMNPIELEFYNEIKIIQKNYENDHNLKILYELYGVVTCINQTEPTEQHFVAFCKSSINNKWYKYDDMKVSDSINNIEKDILKYKIPFALFYKKKF